MLQPSHTYCHLAWHVLRLLRQPGWTWSETHDSGSTDCRAGVPGTCVTASLVATLLPVRICQKRAGGCASTTKETASDTRQDRTN